MKKDIHPKTNEFKATCVCGESFDITSTKESIEVDLCSNCHPFFSGTQKFVDTAGRIEKFQKRFKKESK